MSFDPIWAVAHGMFHDLWASDWSGVTAEHLSIPVCATCDAIIRMDSAHQSPRLCVSMEPIE